MNAASKWNAEVLETKNRLGISYQAAVEQTKALKPELYAAMKRPGTSTLGNCAPNSPVHRTYHRMMDRLQRDRDAFAEKVKEVGKTHGYDHDHNNGFIEAQRTAARLYPTLSNAANSKLSAIFQDPKARERLKLGVPGANGLNDPPDESELGVAMSAASPSMADQDGPDFEAIARALVDHHMAAGGVDRDTATLRVRQRHPALAEAAGISGIESSGL